MVHIHRYKVFSGAMPTTAALVKIATVNGVKTMLQYSLPATRQAMVLSWGFSLDIAPTATGVIELIQTDAAATTGTAHVASGLVKLDPNAPNSLATLGTGNTGYNFAAEGTTTASRLFDMKEIPLAAGATDLTYNYQFTGAERPIVAVSTFLRVRTTFTTTNSSIACWFVVDE